MEFFFCFVFCLRGMNGGDVQWIAVAEEKLKWELVE
jgi:hypothetical protein